MQAISSTNVVAAALIVQVWLSTSFFLTAHLHKDSLPSITFARSDGVEKYPNFLFAILSVTLFNIVLILLSADMYRLWGPVFGDAPLHTISEASTLMLVFSINLFLAAYLVSMTSGSQQSPFTPAVFTLPSLAIFLRMTPVFFVPYSVFAAIIYLVFLYLGGSKRSAESGGEICPAVFSGIHGSFMLDADNHCWLHHEADRVTKGWGNEGSPTPPARSRTLDIRSEQLAIYGAQPAHIP